MKKVLVHGSHSLIHKWVANCPSCGCQFEYDKYEILGVLKDSVPLFVKCPECEQYVRHDDYQKSEINKGLQDRDSMDTMELR